MKGITVIRRPVAVRRVMATPVTVVRRIVKVRKNNNLINVIKREVTVQKKVSRVVTFRRPNVIRVTAQAPILHPQRFKQFFLVATAQGQTAFTLPSFCKANGMIFLAVNGTGQSPIRGDFSVLGNLLTISSGVDIGDEVFGTYEEE